VYTKEDYEKDLKRRNSWRKRWFDLSDRLAWVRIIALIAGLLLLAYSVNFFGVHHQHLPSGDSGDWGTLGDFFGGILNPIVGIVGLVFLAKTLEQNQEALRMSAEELKLSRIELAEARKAQQDLAETERSNLEMQKNLRSIDNITAILESYNHSWQALEETVFNFYLPLSPGEWAGDPNTISIFEIDQLKSPKILLVTKDDHDIVRLAVLDSIRFVTDTRTLTQSLDELHTSLKIQNNLEYFIWIERLKKYTALLKNLNRVKVALDIEIATDEYNNKYKHPKFGPTQDLSLLDYIKSHSYAKEAIEILVHDRK
jgi:uncharacterized membrane protein